MITAGAQGGESGVCGEEMEDSEEMEKESTSNVPMHAADGTFIVGTVDSTVTQTRHSTKRHRDVENVSEDLLNRHIQEYGLVGLSRTGQKCCVVLLQEIQLQEDAGSR